jgi:hypothetical protein
VRQKRLNVEHIDAGLPNVGDAGAGAGPANDPAVIPLRGWPYDIRSHVKVASLFASAGDRVIAGAIVYPMEAGQLTREVLHLDCGAQTDKW